MSVEQCTETIRADDFVEYFLFPDLKQTAGIDGDSNNVSDSLERIRTQIIAEAEKFVGNYIWHKDPFQLIVNATNLKLTNDNDEEGKWFVRRTVHSSDLVNCDSLRDFIFIFCFFIYFFFVEELPPHLHGITFYGENIQDEWFIVELLFHLTKQFSGLIGRVIDSDGEFVLIEAADHLPQWADPETCMQRVSAFFHSIRIDIENN